MIMRRNKSIGGFFSLELPRNTKGELYSSAIRLNSGRSCLEYILRARRYQKIYIPYYTCDAVLEPIRKLNIDYCFYHIDPDFHIIGDIHVRKQEALLYINYFGLMDEYVSEVTGKFAPNIIIDNTQSFFSRPNKGVDTFNTCRKFFGVADGAYLFTDSALNETLPRDHSTGRMAALLDRIDKSPEEAFSEFHSAEQSLSGSEIRQMSKLTRAIMSSIDYKEVATRRLRNFQVLARALDGGNELHYNPGHGAVPMVYPYFCHRQGLRQHLIDRRIYVAKYWPNVADFAGTDSLEADMAEHLTALPIDQRYDEGDMNRIINNII